MSSLPEENPGSCQQKIVIENKHGENLVGLLHETGSKDVVILCHGFQSSKSFDDVGYLSIYQFNLSWICWT
ncbi:hypothetical protein HanHA300_Chr12g0427601 [Helianthus annuus]|nr:hypothetical protein HanHA300_Chr12g0427601 [Helianthus annuus]KAJ0673432.1 hypothetical protein HanLR1_Chr12g0429181 [Helianthus annuus]